MLIVAQCLKDLYSNMSGDHEMAGWTDYYMPNSPQQSNSDDCGVFMLKGIEVLARGGNLTFNGKDITNMRERMYLELVHMELMPLPNVPS